MIRRAKAGLVLLILGAGALSASVTMAQSADKRPEYLLSQAEVDGLKARRGSGQMIFGFESEVRDAMKRVIAKVAEKRGGSYSDKHRSVEQTFYLYANGPPDEIELRDERYITGGACLQGSCRDFKSGYLVDTVTGHVAIAFVHPSDANGKSLPFLNGVSIFMKSCASPEFRAYANQYFDGWGRKHDSSVVTTLTTRC